MALNIPTEGTRLNELKINIVDTQETFEAMKTANKVNANELYFIEQESSIVADSLKTGHTFKVNLASSNASTPFTGEQDINDIGVSGTLPISHGGTGATSAASAPWVQKSGDTMTGVLTMKGNMYNDAYDGALNMNNSDIYGLNSIYTGDTSDGAAEGIHFYRDATHVDTFWVSGGDLLFVPNRAIGTNTTKANSQKISRFTANPTSGQVVVTDGTTGGVKSSGYTIAKSVPSDAKFTDTTYSAGTGISLSGTTFSNSGVRSATINGNYLRVNTNGTNADLTIPYATTAGSATTAGKWTTSRTLTIGNKGQSVDGSQDVSWTLHDILNGSQIGTSTTWQQYNPGVYYVASTDAAFTGEGNPEDANGGLTPYRYGQLIVSRAGNGGVAQFYISHQDSGNSSRGIKYRSGWNSTYNASWDTLLDSTNYTNYTVTKTGTGASGTWGISITGNASTATTASKLSNTAKIGDTNKPVYFTANGVPTAINYSINKDVPSDAVFTDTKVTQNNTTAANDYRVLLSVSANDTAETNTVNKSTNLRYNPSTNTLSTGNITGSGSLAITGNTNLNGETYAESITAGSLLVNGNANFVQSPTAPTPVATSNDTTIATTAFVMNAFTANDAMVFKGIVNANGDLPATHKQGWTYRVATAGTYAGKVCEVGDIIICVTDGTAANNDHWAVIQNNIDGAVTGPASATTNAIARYNGTTGKIIKNSNVTIDDTGNITTPGNINLSTGGANIVWNSDTWQQRIKTTDDSTADTPVFTFQQSSNSGSAWTDLMTIKDNGKVVATTFVGALDGNASTATKATQDESGNNIKASYASSFSISGHTITLQNKNGTSLGTVTVPDNDTKNTAGSTDTSNKIYLIGATSQADNPQTYSDNEVYVQNGTLYAVKTADLSGTANNKPALIVGGADTSTHMEIDANEIQAKTNGTSVAQLYINNDGGLVTVGSGGLAITSLTASQAVSTDANKKLVSTNLTVSDPTASGTGITYIATISQGATGKITATKSTVRSASTSQTGVTQYTEANTNTQLSTLTTTWTATPTDDTLFIRRDTGGGATFGQVKFSTLWNYIKGKITAGTYWANIKISDAAKYNVAPEMATLKLNGNTSATAASTSNVTLVYDTTSQALNFVFA